MNDEMWRPVVGFEGWYEVSNFARVRSVERDITDSDGIVRHRASKTLTPKPNGYVMLGRNGQRNHRNSYKLAAEAFSERLAKREQLSGSGGVERLSRSRQVATLPRDIAALLEE